MTSLKSFNGLLVDLQIAPCRTARRRGHRRRRGAASRKSWSVAELLRCLDDLPA